MNFREELGGREGLVQTSRKPLCAEILTVFPEQHMRGGGNHRDLSRRRILFVLLCRLPSIHYRHGKIHQDQGRLVFSSPLHTFRTVYGLDHALARML